MSLLKIAHVPAATIEPEATVLDAVNVMAARAVVGSGETVAVKYVVQWKEENGDWKWHVD